MNKKEFIDIVAEGAIYGYGKYNILPSLVIAQAVLESNWGKSHIANNIFGIKAGSSWKGKISTRKTKEWNGKEYVVKEQNFRAYDSFQESVSDYLKLIGESKRYEKVKEAANYNEACKAVYESGYATDPKYSEKLVKIIEENRFYEYDLKVKEISKWAFEAWLWAEKNGITDGKDPKKFATREQVATMLFKLHNIYKGDKNGK